MMKSQPFPYSSFAVRLATVIGSRYFVFPNFFIFDHEGRIKYVFTGSKNIDKRLVKAAKKILQMGPKVLVIKKGEHGALLFNEHEVFYAPALPLEDVFDPTGAGDTFAGGFIGYLARTRDISFANMKRALIYGSAMASFCVEKFGTTRMKEITKEEINARIAQFVDLVQFDIKLV